jgi:hypothetical protein
MARPSPLPGLATPGVGWQRNRSWALLALLLLVALVYWPGLGGGYVFDDFPNLIDNTL